MPVWSQLRQLVPSAQLRQLEAHGAQSLVVEGTRYCPAAHTKVHVLVAASYEPPDAHEVQSLLVLSVHVAHELSQEPQVMALASANLPSGQLATHSPPSA